MGSMSCVFSKETDAAIGMPWGDLAKFCLKSSQKIYDKILFRLTGPFSNAIHCLRVEYKHFTHYYNTKSKPF